MTDTSLGSLPRLLYISAASTAAGGNVLSLESRITIGVLSGYFDISLAVVGTVSTVAMNRLRLELGTVRIIGGFGSSGADRPAERGLRRLMMDHLGTDTVSARLQSAIQGEAGGCDAVVVDSLVVWPYRPVGVNGPTAIVVRSLASESVRGPKVIASLRGRPLRDFELGVLAAADMIFTPPEMASCLSELGVSMGRLQSSFNPPDSARPRLCNQDFNRTEARIAYTGFLADQKNIASLNWFLDNIWSFAAKTLPGVELHVVGRSASGELQDRLAQFENVQLHRSGDDRELIQLRCRLVVEPLMFEDHVDAKLINAMARGIPAVTTRHGLSRAHNRLKSGIVAAESRESMVLIIKRLMSDAKSWKTLADSSVLAAREQLPTFELAHVIRREIIKRRAAAGIA